MNKELKKDLETAIDNYNRYIELADKSLSDALKIKDYIYMKKIINDIEKYQIEKRLLLYTLNTYFKD